MSMSTPRSIYSWHYNDISLLFKNYFWEAPISAAYSEPCQTSKTEFFAKMVNGLQQLIIFTKSSILAVWQSSKYASGFCRKPPLAF